MLVDDGWRVTGTTRSHDKAAMLREIGVAPVIVDVFDATALLKAVAESGPEAVIHQLTDLPAGLDVAKIAEGRVRNARIRIEGTRNLVAASVASGVTRLIAQSIAFAYAPGEKPYREDAVLNVSADGSAGESARAVASLEAQVLGAPLTGIVLRYGKLYGPGTGFDVAPRNGPVHVDAAADAARRALSPGTAGIYNVVEDDGTVSSAKAQDELGWSAGFRL